MDKKKVTQHKSNKNRDKRDKREWVEKFNFEINFTMGQWEGFLISSIKSKWNMIILIKVF